MKILSLILLFVLCGCAHKDGALDDAVSYRANEVHIVVEEIKNIEDVTVSDLNDKNWTYAMYNGRKVAVYFFNNEKWYFVDGEGFKFK